MQYLIKYKKDGGAFYFQKNPFIYSLIFSAIILPNSLFFVKVFNLKIWKFWTMGIQGMRVESYNFIRYIWDGEEKQFGEIEAKNGVEQREWERHVSSVHMVFSSPSYCEVVWKSGTPGNFGAYGDSGWMKAWEILRNSMRSHLYDVMKLKPCVGRLIGKLGLGRPYKTYLI